MPYGATARDELGRLERFVPGAFRGEPARWSGRADGARMAFLDRHTRLGGVPIGTIEELEDTPAGLRFAGELLDVPEAHAWAMRTAAGINGVSAEFEPVRTRRRGPDGIDVLEARLYAIAGAHDPAYETARVALRSRGGRTMPPATISYADRLTERLEATREERRAAHAIAEAEERELTDEELERLEELDRNERNLTATIERHREERSRRSAEASALERVAPEGEEGRSTTARSSTLYSGPGAFLLDRARARSGDAGARLRLERALADVTTADAPGIIPTSITGPVLGSLSTRRPLVESARSVPIGDAGMTIVRPMITGGDVDEQLVEKTQVATAAMSIDPVTFTLKTYAGGVDVSWQLIERSSPAALDLIFRKLANRYARRTELVAAAAFTTAVVDTEPITALTATEVIASLIAGASDIAGDEDVDTFPDTLWLSLSAWAKLASVVDGNGRPLFPLGGQGITLGLGGGDQVTIRPVIVPRFTGDVAILGASEFLERYELPGSPVQFRSIDAALLGTNVSVAGLFALGVVDEDAFIELTFPA